VKSFWLPSDTLRREPCCRCTVESVIMMVALMYWLCQDCGRAQTYGSAGGFVMPSSPFRDLLRAWDVWKNFEI
jgi:hypothetical protein